MCVERLAEPQLCTPTHTHSTVRGRTGAPYRNATVTLLNTEDPARVLTAHTLNGDPGDPLHPSAHTHTHTQSDTHAHAHAHARTHTHRPFSQYYYRILKPLYLYLRFILCVTTT